jgi:hypothetical protein
MIFRILDLPPLTGEYELALPPFTNREWHLIKQETGLRPREFDEAWEKGDPDVYMALAVISLRRDGTHELSEALPLLWEAKPRQLVFDLTGAEEEPDRPPVSPTPSGDASSSVGSETPSGSSGSSGPSSSVNGGSEETAPSPTGDPGSVTGSPV